MDNFKQIFDKQELIQLDKQMLKLDQKQKPLKKDDLIEWLTIHYLMYSLTQLISSNEILIPKSLKAFKKHYQNIDEFKIVYKYLIRPNHESLTSQDWRTIYNNVCLELKNSGPIMRRIKIKELNDGWLIKNKWFWDKIYILMIQLTRINDKLNSLGGH